MRPWPSRSCRVVESVLELTLQRERLSSLKPAEPRLPMTAMIMRAHFLLIVSRMPFRGQKQISVWSGASGGFMRM